MTLLPFKKPAGAAGGQPQAPANAEQPVAQRNPRMARLAYMVIDGQEKGFACTIRQFSRQGATIAISGWIGIPGRFTLYVEPEGVRYRCRVVATRGNRVEVAFEG